jgi:hypothetical protein
MASCGIFYTEFPPDQLKNMKIMGINEYMNTYPYILYYSVVNFLNTKTQSLTHEVVTLLEKTHVYH